MIPIAPAGQTIHRLGGNLDVRVEIDTGGGEGLAGLWDIAEWDTDLWGSIDPDWFDFTSYVLGVETHSGAQRWGERFQTGGGSVIVDNTTGIFTPGSDAPNPWYRVYRPGRRIRVVVIPDPDDPLTKIPIITGRLDASVDEYFDAGYDAVSVLNIVDYMGAFAAFNPLAGSATGVQSTDERVHAALDRMGWPADARDVQTGDHSMASSDLAQTTLEECHRAGDAEGGAFFASPDGLAAFKSKDWLTTDTRSTTIQGYVGYSEIPEGAQAAHMEDLKTSWELARVVNDVQFARAGGSLQHVEDEASKLAHGPRSYQRTDFHLSTDTEVLALAVRYLNAFKDSRMRVDEVAIAGVDDPGNDDLNRLLWDTQLGDRLSVLIEPPFGWSVEREVHVMGIRHSIRSDDWRATFRLDDAQTIPLEYWQLNDPILSVLGETTRVA
jgi:hypothetical protein